MHAHRDMYTSCYALCDMSSVCVYIYIYTHIKQHTPYYIQYTQHAFNNVIVLSMVTHAVPRIKILRSQALDLSRILFFRDVIPDRPESRGSCSRGASQESAGLEGFCPVCRAPVSGVAAPHPAHFAPRAPRLVETPVIGVLKAARGHSVPDVDIYLYWWVL